MALPLLLAGTMAAGVLVNAYDAYRTHQVNAVAMDYQKGLQNEITRYWGDYYRNTGFRPRYPYRAGAVFDTSALYRMSYQNTMSVVRAFQPFGSIGGFYAPQRTYKADRGYRDPYHYMYG